jgi:hypothetical protein
VHLVVLEAQVVADQLLVAEAEVELPVKDLTAETAAQVHPEEEAAREV